ncbi:MAG: CPBP family intramembrane metalloprotease [Woeseia sp.]|nr:CPBP family intramembrane metalloprotease [Woeseia sp.]
MSQLSGEDMSGREILKLIAFVLFAEACALFVRSWLQVTLERQGIATWPARNLSYLVIPPILLVLLFPVWRDRLPALRAAFRWQGLTLRIALIAVALGIAARLAAVGGMIGFAGFGWTYDPAAVAPTVISFSCPSIALVALHLLVSALLTPLIEEIINRGWFAQWLARYGDTAAIVGSAMLFAIFHVPQTMIAALVFGLFLGKLFLDTRCLWGPIVAHAVYNSFIVLDWYCLRIVWAPAEISPTTQAIGSLGFALVLVALAFCALVVSKKATGTYPGDPLA